MMTRARSGFPAWVELSGENLPLAECDLNACVAVLDAGAPASHPLPWGGERLREVPFSRPGPEGLLAGRLAYAYRVLRPVAEGTLDTLVDAMVLEGGGGASARVRVLSGSGSEMARKVPSVLGHAFVQGGGSIDLESPDRDFVAILGARSSTGGSDTEAALAEVIGEVPRNEVAARRSKNRPYRKPVTLPPRLARAVVNLAQAPLGSSILDPFCGTGAMLLEAAALGYRISGSDLDAEMVRGTLRNLEAAQFVAERLVQSDVKDLPSVLEGSQYDGVVFDPPYGRQATTGGKESSEVIGDALSALPKLLRKGARAVMLVERPEDLPRSVPGLSVESVVLGERVHRSLTRWIAVLRRPS